MLLFFATPVSIQVCLVDDCGTSVMLVIGDVRVVTAVDRAELRSTVNVIVFNACTTGVPLAMACSGGDLDGDLYGCIWQPELVPPKHCEVRPCDYEQLAATARASYEGDVPESLDDFFVRVISNEALGSIAYMHLTLSDMQPNGARDPLCISLAEAQSLAVDFPKTGVPPRVPTQGLEMVKKYGYPDFMQKPPGVSYTSDRLLGRLYRQCLSFSIDKLPPCASELFAPMDVDLLWPECDAECLDAAKAAYDIYVSGAKRIMAQFSLRTEAELLLCECSKWAASHALDKNQSRRSLRQSVIG